MTYTPEKYAPILTLEEFSRLRDETDLGVVVATSGGFDPIHPGHVSCIVESKAYGDTLVVIVNGDDFLTNKKGKPFQDIDTRCAIVSALRGVDYVVKFEIKDDPTVAVALRAVIGVIFLLLTTPISAHLLARASYLAGYHADESTVRDDLKTRLEQNSGS